jgi:hypothetical protein
MAACSSEPSEKAATKQVLAEFADLLEDVAGSGRQLAPQGHLKKQSHTEEVHARFTDLLVHIM